MPLEKAAAGTPGFSRNIATEMKAGKPQKQAVAIAYSKARGARSDSSEADCVFEEKGQFWFRRPGFREAHGPYASEQEANEAAVKMGVVADAFGKDDPRKYVFASKAAKPKNLGGGKKLVGGAVMKPKKPIDQRKYDELTRKMQALENSGKPYEQVEREYERLLEERNRVARGDSTEADDNRTPQEKLAAAKRYYEQDLRSTSSPAERAQIKEDFESFKRAMIKAGAKADAAQQRYYIQVFSKDGKKHIKDLTITASSEQAAIREAKSRMGSGMVGVKYHAARMDAEDPCWNGYHQEGMKKKGGKSVPNCIPDSEVEGEAILGKRADAAVGFDKSRPDKPWFANVNGKKQYFAFRQQAESAKDSAKADAAVQKPYISSYGGKFELLNMNGKTVATGHSVAELQNKLKAELKKYDDRPRRDSAKADIQVNWGAGNNVATGKSGDYSWKITRDVHGNHDCVIKKDGKRVFSSNAGRDPSVLAQKIEEYIRNRKDSTKADSTPIIVREGDQWIVQVTHGAEKSIFRISTKDYPTEAAALEYATTNPQYTNYKVSTALDSVVSMADELFARSAKADAAANKTFVVKYTNSVDKTGLIEVKASSRDEAQRKAKSELGNECKRIFCVSELASRSDAERDLPGAGTGEGGYSDAREVSTEQYKFSHGKKPSGTGGWAFIVDGKTVFCPGSKSYAEAKKWVLAEHPNAVRIQAAP